MCAAPEGQGRRRAGRALGGALHLAGITGQGAPWRERPARLLTTTNEERNLVTKTIHANSLDWTVRVLMSETADEQGYELIVSAHAAGDWMWSVRTTAAAPALIASGSARSMSGAKRAACNAANRELRLVATA